MKKFLTYYKNRKGITLVVMAFFLVLLLFFLGMAVDIAYMYVVKNQLQVAADAASLAGAERLGDTTTPGLIDFTTAQVLARQEAWKFACKNRAAGSNVLLAEDCPVKSGGECDCNSFPGDLNNGNAATGDIVVGFWNGTVFNPGTPVNAVQVVARRTGETPFQPQVGVFVGQIFRILGGSGWPVMSARSIAVAARPPKADAYFDVCWNSIDRVGACRDPNNADRYCSTSDPCTVDNIKLCVTPQPGSGYEDDRSMGWTSLTSPPCSADQISDTLLCSSQPAENVCLPTPSQICVQNGQTDSFKNLRALMYDPLYDSANKTCATADGKCNVSSDAVTGWWVIVPITTTCPAGTGGSSNARPKDVYGYAKFHITAICASGIGLGSVCPNHQYVSPPGTCSVSDPVCGNQFVQVDSIACIDCADMYTMLGFKTALVR